MKTNSRILGVTLNNASDYRTNGLYQTPNHDNHNPTEDRMIVAGVVLANAKRLQLRSCGLLRIIPACDRQTVGGSDGRSDRIYHS